MYFKRWRRRRSSDEVEKWIVGCLPHLNCLWIRSQRSQSWGSQQDIRDQTETVDRPHHSSCPRWSPRRQISRNVIKTKSNVQFANQTVLAWTPYHHPKSQSQYPPFNGDSSDWFCRYQSTSKPPRKENYRKKRASYRCSKCKSLQSRESHWTCARFQRFLQLLGVDNRRR